MSSLRVMLPSGAVVSVLKVTPIVEQIVCFNGKRRRLIGLAKDMKKEANGLLINVVGLKKINRSIEEKPSSYFDDIPEISINDQVEENWDDVVIGNLRKEQVREILQKICEKGYYDFSCLEYQNLKSPKDLNLGSEYLPYNSENNLNLCTFSNRNGGGDYTEFCFTNYYDEDITVGRDEDITDEDESDEAESDEAL